MANIGRSAMFNDNSTRQMVTVTIGKHTVEMYDTIDELPIVRFHKYQKLLLIDAGIGSTIEAFDQRIEKTRRFLMDGKPDKAGQELENLRQSVFMIQNGLNTQHQAFAALVTKVDNKPFPEPTDKAMEEIMTLLADAPNKDVTAHLEAVKKKIDGELMLYFPAMFENSDIKEYYDILKKRTLAILDGIVKGQKNPLKTKAVEKLTTMLITYTNPKMFSGPESVEIQFDRQFENLCLVLSEQLHVKPKEYSVLEFYNAFDFVRERAKEAQKMANKQR